MRRKAVAVVVAVPQFVGLVAVPSWAAETACLRSADRRCEFMIGSFSCATTLVSFPGDGTGICSGSFEHLLTPDRRRPGNEAMTLLFNYGEPSTTRCAHGDANGIVSLGSDSFAALFSWTRVGATAVMTLGGNHTGVGFVAFEADPNAMVTCVAGGTTAHLSVTIEGVMVAPHTP